MKSIHMRWIENYSIHIHDYWQTYLLLECLFIPFAIGDGVSKTSLNWTKSLINF